MNFAPSISKFPIALTVIVLLTLISCQDEDLAIAPNTQNGVISALPEQVIYPENNPYSEEKEALGRLLFWDPILSGDKDIACVTCHHPDLGYADGLKFSQGVGGRGLGLRRTGGVLTPRNAPTIINTAFNGIDNNGLYRAELAPMFWDSRAESLERQALLPMLSKEEMRGEAISEAHIIDTIVQRLQSISGYVTQFEEVFGSPEITEERILAAIATFERGIVANNSRFDQYMRGDQDVLTNIEIQGMNTFVEVGCADCHGGPMFSDYQLHTIGVRDNTNTPDRGANNNFEFRTPTLRNLSLTAPYMHNGIHATLQDVMRFYDQVANQDGERRNNNVSRDELAEEIRNLDLNRNEIDEIIAFLNTLNDDSFDKTIPANVPSGLPVGGDIE